MRARREARQRRYLRLRLLLVGGVFAAALVVLLGRAVHLQVIRHQGLKARAQREFIKQVQIAPRRGIIFDRNQEELAVSLDVESVYAAPTRIDHPRRTGRRLARALGLPPRQVIAKLTRRRGFVWIARRVDPDQARAVRALNLPGVGLVKESRRFYPYTTLACHLIGFAGLDARGLEGLERQYDRVLRGRPHTLTSLRDALGRTIHLTPTALATLPEGHHLMLTIDRNLQYQVEKVLAATVARYRAKGGMAVVMVPATGEILALASLPAFNPNVFARYPADTWRNRVVTDAFEPGSTFKAFVAAAALMSGRVSLETRFDCEEGSWRVGGRVIHDTHPHGKMTLAEIVKYSSNIGAAKVGLAVGGEALYRAFRAFGFGSRTGVDLPGESPGILRRPRRWGPVELANICFGQGVAVTALQLVVAMSAIANQGLLMWPHVVRAELDSRARLVREVRPRVVRRVMSQREARLLTRMLVAVTESGGTGTRARVPGFTVAGKTGTAQKVLPGGGYSQRDYISSFVGFLPAEDPKAAVLVVIDTPRGAHYGGTVAGPAFSLIARAALAALGVYERTVPVMVQAPAEAQALAAGVTPDLRGLSLRQVVRLAGRKGLKLSLRGWGRVVAQVPEPGRPLKGVLSLRLAPGGEGA